MIEFYAEDIAIPDIDKDQIRDWIEHVASYYNYQCGEIAYVFCSDDYILKVNNDYLQHDYYTDIITFDYCEDAVLSGDLFISLDTVRSNAIKYHQNFKDELNRVIIHGILHLCGIKDKNPEDAKLMRKAEELALEKLV